MENLYLAIVLSPLIASVIVGLFGRQTGRAGAHWLTIMGVAISFLLSVLVLKGQLYDGDPVYNSTVYTWMVTDGVTMEVGFLIDRLSALMMTVVTFVSLMVHIYFLTC
jgi:NADH-quinone oxidoreductase subunit L